MDSLTQIVLGASVGELTLGKKLGNKAQLLGAIAGTLPDLDILMNFIYKDDLSKILIHRSYSHSIIVHVVFALIPAYLCLKWFKKRDIQFKEWYWMWFLGLSTHALLDATTTYGTRLFLPFTNYQVGLNNISVVNPMYTLPFMILTMICLFYKKDNVKRLKWAKRGMYYSSIYMLYTLGVKAYVHQHFKSELQAKNIHYENLYTTPTFFNGELWASIACTDDSLTVGEYSILQNESKVDFVSYKRHLEYEKGFEGKGLKALKWFSQGKYFLEKPDSNTLRVYIVKWGRFSFKDKESIKAFGMYHEIDKRQPDKITSKQPDFTFDEFKKVMGDLIARVFKV
jgi:inner membrane protein